MQSPPDHVINIIHSNNPSNSDNILSQRGLGDKTESSAKDVVYMQPASSSGSLSNGQTTSTYVNTERSVSISTQPRQWQTEPFACLADEESCWWGTWCCWLLHARTIASLGLGESLKISSQFWAIIIVGLILLALRLGPLAIIYFIFAGFFIAYHRGKLRGAIRERYNIIGTHDNDFFFHWCCSCCAVCHEAREAATLNVPALDFCSGEVLSELRHEHAVHENDSVSGGGIMAHINAVSKTSKIILILCGVVGFLSILRQLMRLNFPNILLLFLIFLQPILILYFVYWRPRRKYASLDYVIKLFAIGFWMTTFQSIIIESGLQIVFGLMLMPFFSGPPPQLSPQPSSSPTLRPYLRQSVSIECELFGRNIIGRDMARLAPKLASYVHAVSSSRLLHSMDDGTTDDDANQEYVRRNIVVVVIGLLLMAYVVAAGVEETMKHFIVRCCRFPVPLKDPHTVLVYLMAGALGFATFENIEYVFMKENASALPGISLFESELFILGMRVLMPVHVICSVLQAVGVSKVIMGISNLSLFQILLPAVFLHGTFDFVLFLLGIIQFINPSSGYTLLILSLVIPFTIFVLGSIWAYTSYKKVQQIYDGGWVMSNTVDIDNDNNL